MIKEGDVIAVGISGGKDSLALLHALAGMRRFYPIHYSLIAITCDLGFKNVNFDDIKKRLTDLLPPHEIPVQWEWVDLIPRTSSGKIQRLKLK